MEPAISSKLDLFDRAQRLLPGGSLGNLYNNVLIHRGQGSHVWDSHGNELIDYLMGSGPLLLGHAHPAIVAKVQAQVALGTTFFASNEPAIRLAEAIVSAVPCAEQIRFTCTGTEATCYAMRVARAFRGRDRVLKFEGGYHGMNEYALMSQAPAQPPEFPAAAADSAGIPTAIRDNVLVAPFNDTDTTTRILEQHHDTLGGVIVEPLQRLVCPQGDFLNRVREVTAHYGVPLIFDEVVTGFRLAYGGAQEYYQVVPDLCVLGKVLAGGFPLAAVAGRSEIMACFAPSLASPGTFVPHIGTFNGNPVAAVAGLATLELLREPGSYDRLFHTGRQLMSGLQALLDQAGLAAQVIGEPPVFDVVFSDRKIDNYRDTLRGDKTMLRRFGELLLAQGILRGDSKFYVSLAHTQDDVKATLAALAKVVDELANTPMGQGSPG
ncbi:MAG: aminotransferase class III-fold pyridoxal phosphate-dependent enzyme [Pirellulales bacterium]|nr:aminotransferase class III-fold pyridoxal phosphate-dependent enzyme [Pirellulales bacterium]